MDLTLKTIDLIVPTDKKLVLTNIALFLLFRISTNFKGEAPGLEKKLKQLRKGLISIFKTN